VARKRNLFCNINPILEQCNPWPHVANRHMSISQLLSSCCCLFTVSNSGLLSVQRPRPASHAHGHRQPYDLNSSIDLGRGYLYEINSVASFSGRAQPSTASLDGIYFIESERLYLHHKNVLQLFQRTRGVVLESLLIKHL